MDDKQISRRIRQYRRRRFWQVRLQTVAVIVVLLIPVYLIIYLIPTLTQVERANIIAPVIAAYAIVVAAWQWFGQRREASLGAYFTRLDLPNQRRLAFYEQVIALGEISTTKLELARALKQFYVFYIYAELDNLEYALTRYVEGHMNIRLAERAVRTFMSRCRQSADFGRLSQILVTNSGYHPSFETLVHDLSDECAKFHGKPTFLQQEPHPMKYEELDVVRALEKTP
jgi:hypothetical protein